MKSASDQFDHTLFLDSDQNRIMVRSQAVSGLK